MLDIEKFITDVNDFPKAGVVFKDISPLLTHKFPELIEEFAKLVEGKVDAVVGIESRGFILGSALAQRLGVGFIPMRKKGKLPPPVISESYSLEYGQDVLEIKASEQNLKVLLIDDVLATGGTLGAAIKLCQKANLEITQIQLLTNLAFLNKLQQTLDIPLKSLLTYS